MKELSSDSIRVAPADSQAKPVTAQPTGAEPVPVSGGLAVPTSIKR